MNQRLCSCLTAAGLGQGCQQQLSSCFQLLQSSSCSFILWQLLLSRLGFGPGFLTLNLGLIPELVAVEGDPVLQAKRMATGAETECLSGLLHARQLSRLARPNQSPCGAHPAALILARLVLPEYPGVILSVLLCCCIWSCVIAGTLWSCSLSTSNLQHPQCCTVSD